MTDTELALMKQYEWIIPKQPVPLGHVIEALRKKFHAVPLEGGDIPFLWMHQYNAFHLPKNEQLQLTVPQLKIKAIKIPITEQTFPYTLMNYVPVFPDDEGEDFLYLAYEEQVNYHYSNCTRLFLEAQLMEGISQEELDANAETAMDFFHSLKSYDELYGNSVQHE